MEAQDTCMEARGPSNVNTVDTAASRPRYSLRSTDKVNRRESSVTKVDPHHCAIAETEKQHSSPPPPHSPDLTIIYNNTIKQFCKDTHTMSSVSWQIRRRGQSVAAHGKSKM